MAAVCRLMLEAPFSTRLCEQGHGSLAAEHKVHQEMGSKFVALRSALHQLRFMWTPTQDEKAEARLNTRLAALDRRRNHAVSGRNCFYGEMVSAAREEGFLQFETQQELMTMHVAEYNELPKEAKRFYDAEGRNRTEQNEQALSEEIQYTRSRQDLLQQRAKRQRTEEGTLNSATECRFSDDALERLAERDASGGFPKELVQATCAKIMSSPHDPEEEELRALDLFTADPEVYDDAHPWIKTVCQNRDSFKNVAFRIAADDDAGEAFRFLLAKKKPFWCMLLRMTRRPVAPMEVDAEDYFIRAADYWRQDWTYEHLDFVSAMDVPCDRNGENLQVLQHMHFLGNRRVTSDTTPISFGALAARMRIGILILNINIKY